MEESPAGRVAFSSQSGALGLALLEQSDARGLGLSAFVSIGNKADVSSNDLLEFWEDDDQTDLVLLYLESFGNPRKFARVAGRVARSKPILAMRSGTSQSGSRAAASHTAALAGSDAVVDALFRQAGVLRAETLHDLASVISDKVGNHKEALGHYREALQIRRALVARREATELDRRDLARSLGYVGDLYLEMGDLQQADVAYWESHRIREKLAEANPREYERKFQLARSWDNFGGYQTRRRALDCRRHRAPARSPGPSKRPRRATGTARGTRAGWGRRH